MAEAYRAQTGPERLIEELQRDFITHAEFQALSEQVSALETILQELRNEDKKVQPKKPR